MKRPPFTLLVCPDPEVARREAHRLLGQHGASSWEHRAYAGDEPLPAAFWQDMQSLGLMGGAKALLLRRAQALTDAAWREISPLLCAGPAAWPFLFLEVPFERGRPKVPASLAKQRFFQLAKERGWIWESEGLTARTMPGYVSDRLKEAGIAAQGPVLQALCGVLPAQAAAVDAELAKLALAVPTGGRLSMEHLELVSSRHALAMWEILNGIEEGRDAGRIWREVLGADSGMLFGFIASLTREVRAMWQLASGEGDQVRLPPFVKDKKTAVARRLGPRGLTELFSLALEAEVSVKGGEKSEGQALEELVAGLYEVFGLRSQVRQGPSGRAGQPHARRPTPEHRP